jgi:putative membrane protein
MSRGDGGGTARGRSQRRVKPALAVVGLLGAGLAAYLIAETGAAAVAASLAAAGWLTLVAISVAHLLPIVLRGLGWWVLFTPEARLGWIAFTWARWVREGVDNILPILPVSGVLAGTRILHLRGQRRAGASAVVDLTSELLGQVGFGLVGLVLLLRLAPDDPRVPWAVLGMAIITLAFAGFLAAQIGGLFRHVERLLAWLRGRRRDAEAGAETEETFHDHIQSLYRHRRRFATSVVVHFVGWVASAAELWLALWLMGSGLGLAKALTIESLIFALRSVSFLVPWSAGIQETGYVIVGAIFGLGAEIALALSLLKRGRDLVLGLPVVLVWQAMEGRGLLKRWAGPTLLDMDADPS